MSPATTVLIGNSDDRLTQQQWSHYVQAVSTDLREHCRLSGFQLYGEMHTPTSAPWQSASWSFGGHLDDDTRERLQLIAHAFGQDSVGLIVGESMLLRTNRSAKS